MRRAHHPSPSVGLGGGHAIALPTLLTKWRLAQRGRSQIIVALQELRHLMTQLARGRPLGWVAANLGFQLHQVGEDVGLAPQFVGDHRRLARNRRHHRHADATTLYRFDQRAEIAVTRKQHHLVDMFGEFHGIDRELDIHVALDLRRPEASMNSLVALVTTV